MSGESAPAAEILTPADLARRWRVSPQSILNECQRGKLMHFRVGRQYRIHLRDVLMLEGEQTPAPAKTARSRPQIPDEIGD